MTDASPVPWRIIAEGLALRVRVTPKSANDAVIGLCETPDGPALQVKVRAIPADGAANAAVEKLIAKWLGLPKTTASVNAGGKSRVKLLHVIGEATTLVQLLSTKLQEIGRG